MPSRICPPRALDLWLTHNSVRGEAGPVFVSPDIAEKATDKRRKRVHRAIQAYLGH
jgi:hypothetical protein